MEVENETPSPTVDPSVHVFLLGHSMGGIVAAETLILLSYEQPIQSDSKHEGDQKRENSDTSTADDQDTLAGGVESFMFPHVQGLIAFDTPFLGIAPGAVSYTAEGQYRAVSNAISDVASVFGIGKGSKANSSGTRQSSESVSSSEGAGVGAAAATTSTDPDDVAAGPSWQRWGRYAMFAGALGAAAAGGAAAIYQQRQNIASGLSWVTSHLEFVGCLARTSELRDRLELLARIGRERGIGCTNFYTCLGKGAQALQEKTRMAGKSSFSERMIPSKNRTFCTLPRTQNKGDDNSNSNGNGNGTDDQPNSSSPEQGGISWIEAVNNKAGDEIKAHTCMFLPRENPGLHTLVLRACDVIANSIDRRWYATSSGPIPEDIRPRKNKSGSDSMDVSSDPEEGLMDDAVVVN